ncbi:MAG: phosphoribosylformylglycinamidine synthase subunit PurS [Promethearchaeota archaeon]
MGQAHRVEVGTSRDANLERSIRLDLGIESVTCVETVEVYTLEGGGLSEEELAFLAEEVFSDPVTQRFSVDRPLVGPFDGAVLEVGFKPGVTDSVAITALQAVKDAIGKDLDGAYTSKQYLLHGADVATANAIAQNLIANPLIQRWQVEDGKDYAGFPTVVPRVELEVGNPVTVINLDGPDSWLEEVSRSRTLALSLEEMQAIRDHFRKTATERRERGLPPDPTDVELECLAQTWSEHCKHKIFNARIEYAEDGRVETVDSLFKTFVKGSTERINASYLVSVFKDNAGVIKFNERYGLAFKVETHNSPTALDPYGGALTGIVGCNRDPAGTGRGYRLIFNTDVFCFASPFHEGELPPRLFHPRRVLRGVHKGIVDGGNQSGIPTVNGSIYFDPRFLGKPLVFCGTGAIAPLVVAGKPTHEKAAQPGDLVVMVGGRIGADGIHGATFSSQEINERSPATAVQIGAPIVQKVMLDFLLEARDADLFHAITDNGAGGLSSSVGEMGQDTGARLDLDLCPLKYPGLKPWEILLSEAQERMTLAVPPEKLEEFMALARRREVEATVIGEFTDTGRFDLYYEGRLVGSLPMDFLHGGVPQMRLRGRWSPPRWPEPDLPLPTDHETLLKEMLGRLNICSKEVLVRRYDHEVQGASIVKPFTGASCDGPSDAAVLRPAFDTWEGIAVSHGLCPRYSDVDAYAMAANAVDEAVRNAVCVGADPDYMAGLDNFCWAMGFTPQEQEHYVGMLVRANKALYDVTTTFRVPIISGKDSMYNSYRIGETAVNVPPTMMFSIVGKLHDVRQAVTMDFKQPGDLVYVLGVTKAELGGSEYFDHVGARSTSVPMVDPSRAVERYRRVHAAVREGLVKSCHDCSDGGLGVALAESAFAGGLGLEVDLSKVPREGVQRDDYLLYSESASRLVVTVGPDHAHAFEKLMVKDGTWARVGVVRPDRLFVVRGLDGSVLVRCDVADLKEAWQATLASLAGADWSGGE